MVKKQKKEKKTTGKVEIDFTRIKKIAFNPSVAVIVLILIPFLLSVFIRIQPAYLPVTDTWARETVYYTLKQSMGQQITKQFPYMPEENKQALINQQFAQWLKTNRSMVDSMIRQNSLAIKQRMKNEYGHTYLLAIDPYQYYRYAKDIVEHGFAGDVIINGTPWDMHMVAPLGLKTSYNWHQYLEAYWYKFLRLFGVKDMMLALFWVPVLLSALAVIPAFFIGRKFAGNLGGFSSAVVIAVAAPFVSRSAGGFADTDPYNVLFPLLATWFFVEAIERKDLKSKIIYGALSGISVGIFSFFWEWWFIFDLLLGTTVAYLLFLIIRRFASGKKINTNDFKITALLLLVFVLSSGVIISLRYGSIYRFISDPLIKPIKMYFLKAVAKSTLWPNVFTTVAEQNSVPIYSVIKSMGGPLYFILSLFGIYITTHNFKKQKIMDYIFMGASFVWLSVVILLFNQPKPSSALLGNPFAFIFLTAIPFVVRYAYLLFTKKEENVDIKFSLLIFAWFAMMFFASVRGVRFSLLLVSPFVVGLGIFMGFFYSAVSRLLSKSLELDIRISKLIVGLLVMLLFIQPIMAGYNTAVHEVPSMNDAWYSTLEKINKEAAPNAIINSWWDFGHWFKAIADRAVTFDGASQNTPMAYWIGKSLLASDEKVTLGILRMLDCGSNRAFEELNKVINNTPLSIDILNKIIVMDKDKAESTLRAYNLSDEEVKKVLKYTHCKPPEDYYITSDDMISKSGVWAHFGSWDFKRAAMYRDVKPLGSARGVKLLETRYNLSESMAKRYYYEIHTTKANDWIAPWPSYVSRPSLCSKKDNILICKNRIGAQTLPFIINTTNMDCYVMTTQGKVRPKSLVYPTKEGYSEEKYNGEIPVTIGFLPKNDEFYTFAMSPQLAESTFTKLFFYLGHGMRCFTLFSQERQFTGGYIYTWKVDWNCNYGLNMTEVKSKIQAELSKK